MPQFATFAGGGDPWDAPNSWAAFRPAGNPWAEAARLAVAGFPPPAATEAQAVSLVRAVK